MGIWTSVNMGDVWLLRLLPLKKNRLQVGRIRGNARKMWYGSSSPIDLDLGFHSNRFLQSWSTKTLIWDKTSQIFNRSDIACSSAYRTAALILFQPHAHVRSSTLTAGAHTSISSAIDRVRSQLRCFISATICDHALLMYHRGWGNEDAYTCDCPTTLEGLDHISCAKYRLGYHQP